MTDVFSLSGKRVWVCGHRGMVGAALVRRLASEDCEVLIADRSDVDLIDQTAVNQWVERERPQAVFLAAAKVGGILANDTLPASFLYDNLMIASNVIKASHTHEVEKLLFLGSSCIYPKFADQPISEESLLTGPLEPTNQWYAIAKIAGVKLCQAFRLQHGSDFISAMPTNLYGPGDNYDLNSSHVLPALLRKTHLAKINGHQEVEVWGSGKPRREFLHVDDCADGLVFLMKRYSGEHPMNLGSGSDIRIDALAQLIAQTVGFEGKLVFDDSKPDGTPRKLMDSSRIGKIGWSPSIDLQDGIQSTYRDEFLEN